MTPYEFVTGRGTPLATIAKGPPQRDLRFILLTVFIGAVMLDCGLAIWKVWDKLLARRSFPTPCVVLIALATLLPYLWLKTASERSALRLTAEKERDSAAIEIALRVLYRGLFTAGMIVLLIMITLPQML
ncbi:MAG: hypothetical protein JO340_09120 [Acidobacteriaceae bacterium]|nr:hypothetical protein [Acidobacteriaceae bacterium]